MSRKRELPTLAQVASRLSYEPNTGRLIARTANARRPAGAEAGTLDPKGYRYVSIGGVKLAAHRVAWLLATGHWPLNEIDHINGKPADNRLANLRDVDRVTNTQNRRAAQANNNSSRRLGVTWNRRAEKWQAQIKVAHSVRYLGTFANPEDASAAYLQAKRQHHAGCTI